jgi:hypothetical protein
MLFRRSVKCSPDALSCTDTAQIIALQQHAPTQLHRSGDVYHASMAGPRLLHRLVRTSPGTSPHVTEIRRRHRDSGALGSFDQVTSLLAGAAKGHAAAYAARLLGAGGLA